MKAIKDIIVAPLFTEKSTSQRSAENKYAFRVAVDANKGEIKQAVESRFQVKVESVNTARFLGKLKRTRMTLGRRPGWKKAVVKLRQGETIQEFEGV